LIGVIVAEKIAIVGAGGFGREVKQLIDEINLVQHTWIVEGFFDSSCKCGTTINNIPVLGGMKDAIKSNCQNFVLAIANPSILKELSSKFIAAEKKFPNIIHPSASIGNLDFNLIGNGNIFTFGFYMTTNIKIGSFNIFNTRVTIGHDVEIGSSNIFLPNVQVSGNVSIGDENIFGMNSSILQRKIIGSRNKIGAHSFIATNLGSDQSVFGVPAVGI
jgi:sugar O-acyltransferase (sialic acid O-acetyltransferase NeuD family)